MSYRAGCEVRAVCAPPECKPIYYISRNGLMFVCRPHKGGYVVYEVLPYLNNGRTPVYEMVTMDGSRPKRVNIERLVYCTFVLMEYVPKLKVEFVDGNKYNYRPENLCAKEEKLTVACGLRMQDYASEYEKYRKHVVNYISFKAVIREDDACDICEQAFIDLFTNCDDKRAKNIVGLWIHRAMQLASEYWNRQQKKVDFAEYEPIYGKYDISPSIDILDALTKPRERECFELLLQGASTAEIADETGLSESTVPSYLARARKRLRNYLQTDKELNKLIDNTRMSVMRTECERNAND